MKIQKLWQRWLAACFIGFSLLSVQVAQASWEEASVVVDQSMAEMLQLMNNDELLQKENKEQLLTEIDKVLSSAVDFPYISKRVMAKHYRKASDEERVYFSDVFKTTLLKTYATALVGFKIKEFELVPPKRKSPSSKKQIVTVDVFAASGEKFTLVYFMRKGKEGWKLVNAQLDGINLRLTFKNQFADMVQKNRGDVSAVINSWKEKVDPDASEEA